MFIKRIKFLLEKPLIASNFQISYARPWPQKMCSKKRPRPKTPTCSMLLLACAALGRHDANRRNVGARLRPPPCVFGACGGTGRPPAAAGCPIASCQPGRHSRYPCGCGWEKTASGGRGTTTPSLGITKTTNTITQGCLYFKYIFLYRFLNCFKIGIVSLLLEYIQP